MPPHFEIAATGPLLAVELINFGVVTTGKGFSDLYRPTAIVVLVIELVDVQLAQPPHRLLPYTYSRLDRRHYSLVFQVLEQGHTCLVCVWGQLATCMGVGN